MFIYLLIQFIYVFLKDMNSDFKNEEFCLQRFICLYIFKIHVQ